MNGNGRSGNAGEFRRLDALYRHAIEQADAYQELPLESRFSVRARIASFFISESIKHSK